MVLRRGSAVTEGNFSTAAVGRCRAGHGKARENRCALQRKQQENDRDVKAFLHELGAISVLLNTNQQSGVGTRRCLCD